MSEVSTIGLDIARNGFHANGADTSGRALFNRKISRTKLLEFFAKQPRCLVALDACGGTDHWARELTLFGYQELIPPAYVKPFVKRNKKDAVDAAAICEAARRPNMQFVAISRPSSQDGGRGRLRAGRYAVTEERSDISTPSLLRFIETNRASVVAALNLDENGPQVEALVRRTAVRLPHARYSVGRPM